MVTNTEVSKVMRSIAKKRWRKTSKRERSDIGRARVDARWKDQRLKLRDDLLSQLKLINSTQAYGFQPDDELLDIAELAARLKVPKGTIYELCRNRSRIHGKALPHFKVGRRLKFTWSSVCAWLTELEKAGA